MASAPSVASCMKLIMQLTKRVSDVEKRVDTIGQRFALYWYAEKREPALAIVISRDKTGKADLFVFSEAWGTVSRLDNKEMLKPDDKRKEYKWEPLILPRAVIDLLSKIDKEEDDDGISSETADTDSALSA